MIKNMTRLLVNVLLTASIAVALVSAACGAELVIIANPDISGATVDAKGLQHIYLGKQTRWENDEVIVPVMLKAGPVHEAFVESYLDRSTHRFVTYWRQMIFTGKGVPPRSFVSEEELVNFVAETPGSVGYVSVGLDLTGVKVLSVESD